MEHLKAVSNLVNWRNYDRSMQQIFYDEFGKILEKKMEEFEKNKKELKQNIKQIIEDPKAMATPARKPKPALALSKRINLFKDLQSSAKKADRDKEQYERDKKAQKLREEQLKERAERIKREREEREKRVAKNNQIKEMERKEQEEAMRFRLAEQKKFADEQRRLAGTPKFERTPAKTVATPVRNPKSALAFKAVLNSVRKAQREKELCANDMPKEKTPIRFIEDNCNVGANDMPKEKTPIRFIEDNCNVGANDMPKEKTPISPIEDNCNVLRPEAESDEVVEMTQLEEVEEIVEISAYDMTKEKIPIPATEDNYNVDDLSSADGTDPEDSPRKQIPKWAQKENLTQHIRGLQKVHALEKIDRYFGRIQQPNVLDFFKNYKKKYPKRRSSSAIWDSPMSDPTPGFGRFQKMFQHA